MVVSDQKLEQCNLSNSDREYGNSDGDLALFLTEAAGEFLLIMTVESLLIVEAATMIAEAIMRINSIQSASSGRCYPVVCCYLCFMGSTSVWLGLI
jgi:hypothetical protein